MARMCFREFLHRIVEKVGDTEVYPAGSSETDPGAPSKRKDNGTADTKDRDRRKHNDVSSASRIFM